MDSLEARLWRAEKAYEYTKFLYVKYERRKKSTEMVADHLYVLIDRLNKDRDTEASQWRSDMQAAQQCYKAAEAGATKARRDLDDAEEERYRARRKLADLEMQFKRRREGEEADRRREEEREWSEFVSTSEAKSRGRRYEDQDMPGPSSTSSPGSKRSGTTREKSRPNERANSARPKPTRSYSTSDRSNFHSLPTRPAPPPRHSVPPSTGEIAFYFNTANAAFANLPALTAFPAPPSWSCGDSACASQHRTLEACSHNIRYVFQKCEDLKAERLRWHPDKFSAAPESARDEFKKKAAEVFVVVNELHRSMKG